MEASDTRLGENIRGAVDSVRGEAAGLEPQLKAKNGICIKLRN